MSDRVLLIGGSGFIGTHLCNGLRARGYWPVVFDRVAPARAAAVFLGRIAEDGEIAVWGDGRVVRDYLYVGDLIGALISGLERPLREEEPRVFNIGSGQGTSVLGLIESMEHVTERKARVRFTPGRKADAPSVVLNAARALDCLGWKTTTSLEAGLRRTWDWVLRR